MACKAYFMALRDHILQAMVELTNQKIEDEKPSLASSLSQQGNILVDLTLESQDSQEKRNHPPLVTFFYQYLTALFFQQRSRKSRKPKSRLKRRPWIWKRPIKCSRKLTICINRPAPSLLCPTKKASCQGMSVSPTSAPALFF